MAVDFKAIVSEVASAAYGYAKSIITGVASGNILSISLVALIILVLLAVLWRDSRRHFFFTKNVFIIVILTVSLYFIATNFARETILAHGLDELTLIVAIAGFLIGVFIIVNTIRSIWRAIKRKGAKEEKEEAPVKEKEGKAQEVVPMTAAQGKSLLMVIGSVMVAEFGIFSSPTIGAPNPTIGMAFFGAFLLGVFIFLKATYARQYLKGVFHSIVALVFGFGLSLLLGHYWAGYEWSKLLSQDYFATTSLVALISGIALSLLVGGKT